MAMSPSKKFFSVNTIDMLRKKENFTVGVLFRDDVAYGGRWSSDSKLDSQRLMGGRRLLSKVEDYVQKEND